MSHRRPLCAWITPPPSYEQLYVETKGGASAQAQAQARAQAPLYAANGNTDGSRPIQFIGGQSAAAGGNKRGWATTSIRTPAPRCPLPTAHWPLAH